MASRQGVASMFAMALLLGVFASIPQRGAGSTSIDVTNRCEYTVWAAISSGAGGSAAPALDSTTGFELAPGESCAVPVPSVWSGRLWGRTDCGSWENCHDYAPVTIAEFSIDDGSRGMDYYGISIVDGYNLPILVEPHGAAAGPGGRCRPAACVLDLNSSECPAELRVLSAAGTGAVAACKSACLAFGAPSYCCAGAYGSADTCRPSAYSDLFKRACPQAITYAYDTDAGSVFTCRAGETAVYAITFCPASTTSSGPGTAGRNQPTPPYAGNGQEVGPPSGSEHISLVVAVLGVVAAVLSVLAAVLGVWKSCFS